MRGALRERPRVAIARLAGVVVLVAVGFALGYALKPDPEPATPTAVSTQLNELRQDKRISSAALRRAERARTRQAAVNRSQRRRLRAAATRNLRLRRALVRAGQPGG